MGPSGPAGSGTGGSTVKTAFNSLGGDDTARFTELVRRYKGGWRGEVEFEVRVHNCPIQIPTIAGMRWVGTETPSSEFGTGTVINYTGGSGTSMFSLYTNSGYNYPSNGVSRDSHFHGIQFNAGNDRDFLPPAPGGFDGSYVQWYWSFTNCGWVGWRNIVKGWGTGLDLLGKIHLQGNAQTPWTVGGSECKWFGEGSLVDSGNANWMAANQPFLNWSLSKSTIGSVMLSARRKSYQLLVTYGHNSRAIGTEFDAPDSMPTEGHQVRFQGTANDFSLTACSFKGGQGIQCITGPTEVLVNGCGFHGNRGLARVEAGFTGKLVWGANSYGTTPKVIYAASASQVVLLDPRVTIKSLDGATTLQGATR